MPMGTIIIMVQGIITQSITAMATANIIDTDSMGGIIDRRSTTADTKDMVIICIDIIA